MAQILDISEWYRITRSCIKSTKDFPAGSNHCIRLHDRLKYTRINRNAGIREEIELIITRRNDHEGNSCARSRLEEKGKVLLCTILQQVHVNSKNYKLISLYRLPNGSPEFKQATLTTLYYVTHGLYMLFK